VEELRSRKSNYTCMNDNNYHTIIVCSNDFGVMSMVFVHGASFFWKGADGGGGSMFSEASRTERTSEYYRFDIMHSQ